MCVCEKLYEQLDTYSEMISACNIWKQVIEDLHTELGMQIEARCTCPVCGTKMCSYCD